MKLDLRNTLHKMERINLVSLRDNDGFYYDHYKCDRCGIDGKRYGFDNRLTVSKRPSLKVLSCTYKLEQIWVRITECNASGPEFSHCSPGSLHKVIKPPKGKSNGIWIDGPREPILLYASECKLIVMGK